MFLTSVLDNTQFNGRGQLLFCGSAPSDTPRWNLQLIDGPHGEVRILNHEPLRLSSDHSYYFGRDLSVLATHSDDDRLALRVLQP
ncbi:MAG: hypothetical protein AAGD10_14320 [Myxococcota bacterium]